MAANERLDAEIPSGTGFSGHPGELSGVVLGKHRLFAGGSRNLPITSYTYRHIFRNVFMKRLGFFKPDIIIGAANCIGLPLTVVFAFSMIVWPWIAGRGNWGHVQDVWDRWQSLNVGLMAFIASVAAFNIARYNADRQRARDFLAAKASLPATLSSLNSYFNASARLLLSV